MHKKTIVAKKGYEDEVYDATKEVTQDIRFTTRNEYLYIIARHWEDDIVNVKTLSKQKHVVTSLQMLGTKHSIAWEQTDEGLFIQLPKHMKNEKIKTYVFKIKL